MKNIESRAELRYVQYRRSAPFAPSIEASNAGLEDANSSAQRIGFRLFVATAWRASSARSSSRTEKKGETVFEALEICGVGWHTFRHTVGTLLAELGEHQLTIRDYLGHSNLSVTNRYLQAASATKRRAQEKLVDAILPVQLRVTTLKEEVAP